MTQLNFIQFTFFKTFLILLTLPALPLKAAMPHPYSSVTTIKSNVLATSVGDIVDEIKPKRRGKGSRGQICVFAPIKLVDVDAKLEESQETTQVWSDRPLFLWQGGTPKKLSYLLREVASHCGVATFQRKPPAFFMMGNHCNPDKPTNGD